MVARPVIIDCDPGVDDALALLLACASPDELDILGITTVAGNVKLARTTANARAVCVLAGRPEIAIHAGCDRPLARPLETAAHIHGESGLGGAELSAPAAAPEGVHGADFIVDTLRGRDDAVWLLPTGPLSNIATALRRAPDIVERIAGIVLMGGAAEGGNITPFAEFNFHVDPHAADEVMRSGASITMIGLDVTRRVQLTPDWLASLRALGTPVSDAATSMLEGYGEGAPLHDPCVIAYLLRPELFSEARARVSVEIADRERIGQSRVEWGARGSNATVVEAVDAGGFFDLLIERFGRL